MFTDRALAAMWWCLRRRCQSPGPGGRRPGFWPASTRRLI